MGRIASWKPFLLACYAAVHDYLTGWGEGPDTDCMDGRGWPLSSSEVSGGWGVRCLAVAVPSSAAYVIHRGRHGHDAVPGVGQGRRALGLGSVGQSRGLHEEGSGDRKDQASSLLSMA